MRKIIIALAILFSCTEPTPAPTLDAGRELDARLVTLAAPTAIDPEICQQLFTCPEIGCNFAPGPAPECANDPGPEPCDAGLHCLSIKVGNPCFCVPFGAGADSWCSVTAQQIGGVNGVACSEDAQCSSGFCRDNMCCNSDCGGGGPNGNTGDCQACSTAHHGQADGTCTTIADTSYTCRLYASGGPLGCDLSERCDGSATTCPPDLGRREGLTCSATTGAVCPANDAGGAPHICPTP
jgi:hypothetical protein